MSAPKRILITGASSGLGAEMARQFAAGGADLALCARRIDRLESLRDEITADHPQRTVTIHALDVDDHDAVFRVFRAASDELGGLDRVVVNAGLGKGAPVGTGRFDVNKQTITTNLLSALAQCEAAMELFRAAGAGHLVVVSSISALRGMPKSMTAYAASKAGIAAVAEGIRSEMLGSPIKVTTLFPGYIESEMNERVAQRTPLMTNTVDGVRAMVRAIDREVATAAVPAWPWRPLSVVIRHAPLGLLRRLG
jgi:NADP-dependent 3-hydroxy acid dehydrogenase YdfG